MLIGRRARACALPLWSKQNLNSLRICIANNFELVSHVYVSDSVSLGVPTDTSFIHKRARVNLGSYD